MSKLRQVIQKMFWAVLLSWVGVGAFVLPCAGEIGCLNVGRAVAIGAAGARYMPFSLDAFKNFNRSRLLPEAPSFYAIYPAGTVLLPVLDQSGTVISPSHLEFQKVDDVVVFEPREGTYGILPLDEYRAAGGNEDPGSQFNDALIKFAEKTSGDMENAWDSGARAGAASRYYRGGLRALGMQGDRLYFNQGDVYGIKVGEVFEVQQLIVTLKSNAPGSDPLEWKPVKVGSVEIVSVHQDGVVVGKYSGQPLISRLLNERAYRAVFEGARTVKKPVPASSATATTPPCYKDPFYVEEMVVDFTIRIFAYPNDVGPNSHNPEIWVRLGKQRLVVHAGVKFIQWAPEDGRVDSISSAYGNDVFQIQHRYLIDRLEGKDDDSARSAMTLDGGTVIRPILDQNSNIIAKPTEGLVFVLANGQYGYMYARDFDSLSSVNTAGVDQIR